MNLFSSQNIKNRKWVLFILVPVFSLLLLGCELPVFRDATNNFDNLIGDRLAEKAGATIDRFVAGGEDEFGEEGGVTISILTPTPTPDPDFVATPTPFVVATPTPMLNEPESTLVDEFVFATESCNVRSGWSTEYLISGGLAENDCVHRVAKLSNGWSKISYNGAYAYVYSEYLTNKVPDRIGTKHLDVMQYTVDSAENGEDVYILSCKNILQRPQLINGPEITCLTIVLKYLGYDKTDKVDICDKYLDTCEPGEKTPFEAYVGDPKTFDGYGCYAPVIVKAANAWFDEHAIQKKAVDISGSSMLEMLSYVKSGTPVICWTTTNLIPTTYGDMWEIDGKLYTWRNNEHCVVICGYNMTKHTLIVCDPLKGLLEYDMDTFYERYREQYSSACFITNKY